MLESSAKKEIFLFKIGFYFSAMSPARDVAL
jgi:hypothetical protein